MPAHRRFAVPLALAALLLPAPADAGTARATAKSASGAARPAKAGEGAWANFDFVPGETVLFSEDFAQDQVGDFPRRLTLKTGNFEVVEWEGGRYLRGEKSGGDIEIHLPGVLPERFTVEFDYSGPAQELALHFSTAPKRNYVWFSGSRGGIRGGAVQSEGRPPVNLHEQLYRARIMADGGHVKVYMNDTRVANVPNAELGRSDRILIRVPKPYTKLIGNLRVAAGGRDLYDALARDGRVSTQGIYFDSGSDRIRPESTPTLVEIARLLQAHPELRLAIEGHTDSSGETAANQDLSERRAAAVKRHLIESERIAADRLESRGFGESKPAGSNDTPEGRQNNRRVELVRL